MDVFKRGVVTKYTSQFQKHNIIPEDPFLNSNEYHQFEKFKISKTKIRLSIRNKCYTEFNETTEQNKFIQTNPEYYFTYVLLGDIEHARKNYSQAVTYYQKALQKNVPSLSEINSIHSKIIKCKK